MDERGELRRSVEQCGAAGAVGSRVTYRARAGVWPDASGRALCLASLPQNTGASNNIIFSRFTTHANAAPRLYTHTYNQAKNEFTMEMTAQQCFYWVGGI